MLTLHAVRVAAVASLIALAAGVAGTSTACWSVCTDSALKKGECERAFGTFDHEECACVGARPYESPPTAPAARTCSTDLQCDPAQLCEDSGHCIRVHCDQAGNCTCDARGYCVTGECMSDLDCRTEARCEIRSGAGACVSACAPDAGATCPPGNACATDGGCARNGLSACEYDLDCRKADGAKCQHSRCRGPSTRNDGGASGAGADGG